MYINEARRGKYPTMLTDLPLTLSKLILFLDADVLVVHFSHNNALIGTMLIDKYRVSKTLIDGGSSVNILYGGALDSIEDTAEIAQAMIN